jgi:hypothetical protein
MARTAWGITLAAALTLAAGSTFAAPSARDREEAGQLAAEAKKAVREGDFKKALKKYKRADELVPQVAFKLAAGRILADLGHLVEGAAALRAATEQKPAGAAEVQAQGEAKTALAELERRIPKLHVEVFKPEASKVSVRIDDQPIEAGTSKPLNPGKHEVVATAAGYQDWQKTVRLDESEKKSVEISMRAAGEAGAAAEAGGAEPEADKGDADDAKEDGKEGAPAAKKSGGVPKWAAWSAWGVTAASLGVGVAFGVFAIQTTNQVLTDYNCLNGVCPGPGFKGQAQNAQDDLDVAKMNGNISTAFFVVAGVSAVGASVLTYFAYRKPKTGATAEGKDSVHVMPLVGPGFTGISGTF